MNRLIPHRLNPDALLYIGNWSKELCRLNPIDPFVEENCPVFVETDYILFAPVEMLAIQASYKQNLHIPYHSLCYQAPSYLVA